MIATPGPSATHDNSRLARDRRCWGDRWGERLDLRHTAVSWWIAAGADVKQIAVWAGHSSVATVLDRYGHLLPDRNDGIMDALGAFRAAAVASEADVIELHPAEVS